MKYRIEYIKCHPPVLKDMENLINPEMNIQNMDPIYSNTPS